jgi:hypothetical protein
VKLFIVLILAIIFVGPTLAKSLSKQETPTKRRGLLYRLSRRYGLMKVLVGVIVIVVIVPTALWASLSR